LISGKPGKPSSETTVTRIDRDEFRYYSPNDRPVDVSLTVFIARTTIIAASAVRRRTSTRVQSRGRVRRERTEIVRDFEDHGALERTPNCNFVATNVYALRRDSAGAVSVSCVRTLTSVPRAVPFYRPDDRSFDPRPLVRRRTETAGKLRTYGISIQILVCT